MVPGYAHEARRRAESERRWPEAVTIRRRDVPAGGGADSARIVNPTPAEEAGDNTGAKIT